MENLYYCKSCSQLYSKLEEYTNHRHKPYSGEKFINDKPLQDFQCSVTFCCNRIKLNRFTQFENRNILIPLCFYHKDELKETIYYIKDLKEKINKAKVI